MEKPGYKTTEFWLTLFNTFFMALVAFGVVEQAQADQWLTLLAPLVAAILPLALYIWSRTKVKAPR